MAAGEWVNDFMSEEFANVLGGAILIAIGFYGVAHAVRRRNGAPSQMGRGAAMSTGEAVALAVSLTFNNLGSGLGAGISHVGIALTAVLTTVASVAAIAGGYVLGRRAAVVRYFTPLGGRRRGAALHRRRDLRDIRLRPARYSIHCAQRSRIGSNT